MRLPPLCLALLALGTSVLPAAEPAPAARIPDGLVVLTFDDSVASHATYVAPLLKKHGFGATFYITEGFEFLHGVGPVDAVRRKVGFDDA